MRKPVWMRALVAALMALSVAAIGRAVVQADDGKPTRDAPGVDAAAEEPVILTGYVGEVTYLPESHTTWYGNDGRLSVSLYGAPNFGGGLLKHGYVYTEGAAVQQAPRPSYLYNATTLSAMYQNLVNAMLQEAKVVITLPHDSTQQILHIRFMAPH